MPILGIMASQISGHLWQPEGAYDSLATVTVPSGGVASITFAGIPSTYKHLQIRYFSRDNAAGGNNNLLVTFNNDTAGNYSWHYLTGDGSSAFAGANTSTTSILSGKVAAATAGASIFGVGVIDILDYQNTNKYKTLRALTGNDNNGSGSVFYASGLWQSTSAITSISLSSGNTQQQYSQFALYGVK
jgi:hypothetical protein